MDDPICDMLSLDWSNATFLKATGQETFAFDGGFLYRLNDVLLGVPIWLINNRLSRSQIELNCFFLDKRMYTADWIIPTSLNLS